MASDLSAAVRVPSMYPYRCIRVPEGVKIVSSLSAIMYEPDVFRWSREVWIIANYITLGMVSRPCVPEGGREV